MADVVLRWLAKLSRLSDAEYFQLHDLMKAHRPRPLSNNAERQRRYRAKKAVTVTRDSNGDGGVMVTRNGNGHDRVTVTRNSNAEVVSLPAFDLFWKLYPKHIGKGAAVKAWKQGNCEAKAEFICSAVRAQMAYFQSQGPKYTPNPATWLNQKRWDDEPPMPSLLSEKTRGNVASLAAFVEGVEARDRVVP